MQYFVWTSPPVTVLGQQSPPSYSHPLLLFSSSQLPSPLYCGSPHVGSVGLPWLSGSTHLHCNHTKLRLNYSKSTRLSTRTDKEKTTGHPCESRPTFVQYFVWTSPPVTVLGQQSPPSYSHPLLLFSSSQLPSPLYCGSPHVGSVGLPWLSGLIHAHCEHRIIVNPVGNCSASKRQRHVVHYNYTRQALQLDPTLLQYFVFTMPPSTVFGQQSPPSYSHPLLLFSSSQLPSPL